VERGSFAFSTQDSGRMKVVICLFLAIRAAATRTTGAHLETCQEWRERHMKAATIVVLFALLVLQCESTAAAATVTYYYTNPQGTPLATADASGSILSTSDYRPYGAQALGTPMPGPGYTGHVNDPDTDLVYMQARYYDSVAGRFLSTDPAHAGMGDVFSFNRYAYANNNPVLNIDPDGRETYTLTPMVNSKINTIVTDGKGAIKLHLGNADNMGRVVLEGLTRHEGTHQSDFYINCDQTCGILKDAPADQQIKIDGTLDAAKSEVRASSVELDYLKAEKNKMRNQREKPEIENREKQMKDYKDDAQKVIDDASQPETQEPPTQPNASP
jgi:RHS repeat-associated protein